MAKFYVRSGKLNKILQADDSAGAALWAVHTIAADLTAIYDDPWMTNEERLALVLEHGFSCLGEELAISERGFAEESVECSYDTFETLMHWHQWMTALSRIAATGEGEHQAR